MKTTSLFFTAALLLLLPLLSVNGALGATKTVLGGPTDADPKDNHVIEIAQYAVKEHNNQSGESIKFKDVIFAQSQVVAGISYRVVIVGDDGSAYSKLYVARVLEKSWEHSKKLTQFNELVI